MRIGVEHTAVTNREGSRIFRHQNRRSIDRFSLLLMSKCCFTATETVGLLGTGAQDVHLDFHTAPEPCIDLARPSSALKEGSSWQLWLLSRGDVNFCVRDGMKMGKKGEVKEVTCLQVQAHSPAFSFIVRMSL